MDPETSGKNETKSKLFIVSGPSGAGKGTLVTKLLEHFPEMRLSISATTRRKRPHEVDGVDYYFLSEEEFKEREKCGEFLETAKIYHDHYGTFHQAVKKDLLAGHDVILEIDVQGAFQVKERIPDSILIFILPPSLKELESRLRKRDTERGMDLSLRLCTAKGEMKAAPQYDHIVVNDDVDRAANELIEIVKIERAKDTIISI